MFQKSPFLVDTHFKNTLFLVTPLIGEELKKIEKSHGRSLNNWVGGLIYITVQTFYDLQYLTMCLSIYINAQTKLAPLPLRHGMEYLTHHPHEPIMYSRKKIFKTN